MNDSFEAEVLDDLFYEAGKGPAQTGFDEFEEEFDDLEEEFEGFEEEAFDALDGYETFLDEAVRRRRTPGPVFSFVCPAGCHFGNEARCRAILRIAVQDAIRLATVAASRLETRTRSLATVRIFRSVFGHPPSRAVPWGGGRDSGGIVARRYRLAARALRRRRTRYECANIPPNARVLSPARVLIGPSFWRQNRQHRAGTILHEMMHQYFLSFIRHDPRERRRNNAHCFEVFALRASRIVPLRGDVRKCISRPA